MALSGSSSTSKTVTVRLAPEGAAANGPRGSSVISPSSDRSPWVFLQRSGRLSATYLTRGFQILVQHAHIIAPMPSRGAERKDQPSLLDAVEGIEADAQIGGCLSGGQQARVRRHPVCSPRRSPAGRRLAAPGRTSRPDLPRFGAGWH